MKVNKKCPECGTDYYEQVEGYENVFRCSNCNHYDNFGM